MMAKIIIAMITAKVKSILQEYTVELELQLTIET